MYGGELDGQNAKCIMLKVGTDNTWHRQYKSEAIAAGIRAIEIFFAIIPPATNNAKRSASKCQNLL